MELEGTGPSVKLDILIYKKRLIIIRKWPGVKRKYSHLKKDPLLEFRIIGGGGVCGAVPLFSLRTVLCTYL